MKKRSFDSPKQNSNVKLKAVLFSALIAGSIFTTGLTAYAEGSKVIESQDSESSAATGKEKEDNIPIPTIEVDYSEVNFPRVCIKTAEGNGNTLTKADDYVDAQITVIDPDGTTIDAAGEVKIRGNTTAQGEKKPYTIKFADKQDVFGMGEAKKWALLANSYDPTLLRNCVAFNIAEELGLSYTSEHEFVEVYMDDVFKGCYELYEPVEAKKGRIDLTTKKNKDFLIQYESSRIDNDVVYFKAGDYRFEIKEPDEPTAEQTEYITETMNEIVDVLKTYDYKQISEVIDVDSFAAYYLLNEYLKTADFNFSSVYYYYKDGILYAGPAWDYDLSAGNVDETNKKKLSPLGQDANVQLYSLLCNCPEFMTKVREVYKEHYSYLTNVYADGGLIDQLAEKYKDVFARNFSEAGWDVKKSYSTLMRKPDATYEENIGYFKNWLSERNDWMTEYYSAFNSKHQKKYSPKLSSALYVYAEAGPGKVTLKWNTVSYAQKYCVVAYIQGNWRKISEGYGNVYVIEDLKPGQEYQVAVLAMFNGVWERDYSNAITIAADDISTQYPNITSVITNKETHQFKMYWSPVKKAEQYGVAVKIAGRWAVKSLTTMTSLVSPELTPNSSCEVVVCAKVNGKWDLTNIDNRAVKIRVP